jgi:hypothetical protein
LLFSALTVAEIAKCEDNSDAYPMPITVELSEETKTRLFEIAKMNAEENQIILTEYAQNGSDFWVRHAAVYKLIDPAIIAEIAKNEKENVLIRETAVKKLEDQTLLAELARNDPDGAVRREATYKLKDQELITEIAMNDASSYVRVAAAATLEDKMLLVKFATTGEDVQFRALAISRISDQQLLAKIAMNDVSERVREQAARGLHDQALLVDVVKKTNHNDPARYWAIRRLTDQTLADIAQDKDVGDELRKAVETRVNELKRIRDDEIDLPLP